MKQLEAIGNFITTLDSRRTGAGILILLLAMLGMGYACFTLYNETISTKNESNRYKDALLARANELLREADNKRVEMNTMYQDCKQENKDLKNLLKNKIK